MTLKILFSAVDYTKLFPLHSGLFTFSLPIRIFACISFPCIRLSPFFFKVSSAIRFIHPNVIFCIPSFLPASQGKPIQLFRPIYNSNLKSPEEAPSRPHCTLISAHIFHPPSPHFCTPSLIFNLKKSHISLLSFC